MSKFRNFEKYEVYEDGRIWSYKSKKFLKPQTDTSGYKFVLLSDNNGNAKFYRLHRVIYESVSGEPIPEGIQVNHINEDKTDNRFENLNLMTQKQNINFGTRNSRARKSLSKQVGAYKNGKLAIVFPSTIEAHRQGYSQSAVSKCCRNCYMREGNNMFKGYEWKYL